MASIFAKLMGPKRAPEERGNGRKILWNFEDVNNCSADNTVRILEEREITLDTCFGAASDWSDWQVVGWSRKGHPRGVGLRINHDPAVVQARARLVPALMTLLTLSRALS